MIQATSSAAIPDLRYAFGVGNGPLAELVGVGPAGVRWKQVAVIATGTWLGSSSAQFQTVVQFFGGTEVINPADPILRIVSPLIFVFTAITAVRSFQASHSIALYSALLYSGLVTALRLAATTLAGSTFGLDYWLRSGAVAFSWMALTMVALQFSVEGASRWLRMTGALVVASFVQSIIVAALYLGDADVEQWLTFVLATVWAQPIASALWTLGFWLGLTKFGR